MIPYRAIPPAEVCPDGPGRKRSSGIKPIPSLANWIPLKHTVKNAVKEMYWLYWVADLLKHTVKHAVKEVYWLSSSSPVGGMLFGVSGLLLLLLLPYYY